MPVMNEIKNGADLTHPKPSIGYVMGAIVAIAVLGFAFWLYQKAKTTVTNSRSVSNMSTGLEAQATTQLSGFL